MANRPMFDDDNLPAWLTKAGITGGGGEDVPLSSELQQPAPETPAAASGSSDLSWMDSAWDSGSKSAEPPAEVESSSLPWFSGDSEQQDAFSAPASSGDTPWMSDVESPAASGGAETMPWMTDAAPSQPSQEPASSGSPWDLGALGEQENQSQPAASSPSPSQDRPGLTGKLPWRQGVSEPADQPPSSPSTDSDAIDFSWMTEPGAQPASPEPGAETSIPNAEATASSDLASAWSLDSDFQDSADSVPTQPEPAPEPSAETDWMADLKTSMEPPPEQPKETPPEPARPTGMIKRLGTQPPPSTPQTPAEPPAQPVIKKLGATPPPASEPVSPPAAAQPSIKKLPTQPPPASGAPAQPSTSGPIKKLPTAPAASAPAQPPPPGPIKKLPTKPQPADQPDLSNMTYEEWERSQIQKEEEAKADPGDKLLEEIPDWFASGAPSAPNAPAAEPNAPAGAELMPEWFLGMEEKSDAPAPDWFSNMDLSATSLVGPQTVQTPPATPPTPPTPDASSVAEPSADDVPDWFKGESPVAGIDFESMFVTPTDSESSPPASKSKPASLLPPEPEQVPPVPAEPEAAVSDLDWMSGMPDFDKAADADDTVPPESILATPSAPAEDANWMSAMPDFGEEPTEIPPPLSTPQPASESAEAESALPVADDLLSDLDWLNEPVARTPAAPLEAAPAEEPMEAMFAEDSGAVDEILGSLDWMGGSPAQPETPAAAEDDVPEWMRDMAPSELLAPASPPEPAPARLDSSDDWLKGVEFSQASTESASQETPAAPAVPADSKPSSEMPPAQPEKVAGLDLEQKVGSSDIDSLLHLSSAESQAITRADQPPSAVLAPQGEFNLDLEANELDTILGAPEEPVMMDLLAGAEEASGVTAETTPSPTEEQSRPKRLTRLTAASPEAAAPEQPLEAGGPQEVLPEWVENLKPTEGPVVVRVGDQQVRMQEEPLGKVPAAVRRMREQSKAFRERQGATPAPESGPLSGIESAIPIIGDAVKPGALTTGTSSTLSEQHMRRVKIIQGILVQEERLLRERTLSEDEREAQAATKVAARPRVRVKVDRLLITLVLALAVIAPFFTDALNLASVPDMSKLTAAQDSVAKQVDALQADNPVLVAFEYGPTGAGELDILARAAILDILKHKARPIIVSTNPVGIMHAQTLMAAISADPAALKIIGRDTAHPLVARQDYVVLRYLPGGATGVRSLVNAILSPGLQSQVVLSSDSEGQSVDAGALKLANLRSSPAFILVETPEDVRNWAEQYRPGANEKPLGMVFLSSAAASAAAQAYTSGAANVFGPLVGLRDAVSYEQTRGLTDLSTKVEAQRWQSVGLAGLLAVVMILFGSAINLIRSLRKRESR